MAYDVYLAVVDSTGAPVPGETTADRLTNPLRGNATVAKPFRVSAWSFAADAPTAAGGGAGKVDPGELVVDLPFDSASAVLFRALCTGRRFRSVDVLVVYNDGASRPTVTSAVGVGSALLTNIAWTGDEEGTRRRLRVDGQVFSVGSATQRSDGSFDPFLFASFNVATGGVS